MDILHASALHPSIPLQGIAYYLDGRIETLLSLQNPQEKSINMRIQ